MNKFDITVVGGGISGLLISCLLVARGYHVCLLESGSRLGGYLQNITKDQIPYGAHHIAIPDRGFIDQLFQHINIKISSELIPADDITIFHNGKRYDLSFKLDDLRKQLTLYFPNEEVQINKFINYVRSFAQALAADNKEDIKSIFMDTVFKSFEQFLKTYFQDTKLIGVLSAIGPSYADVYLEDSAFSYLSLFATYGGGTYYFKDYGESLIKSLREYMDNSNSIIRYKFKANKICKPDNEYHIYNDDGQQIITDHIVIACYPVDLLQTLPQTNVRQQKLLEKIYEMKIGSSAWRFYYRIPQKLFNNEYIYHYNEYRSPCLDGKTPNFIISTMDKSKGQINLMATVVCRYISEDQIQNIILPHLHAEIKSLLLVEDKNIELAVSIGRSNREVVTSNKNGSVFGWVRDAKGNLISNMIKSIPTVWEGVYVVGHWSSTFGIYGSILTVIDTLDKIDKKREC
ncbi:phytoene desaturase family protein [Paenibacillus crassostreae]|uniref:Amine oxidase domain-containing protein n=1 Tax=Paenibacillus crassostreae TaxID=1763538 RepID=A0A167FAW5_9BACL|nr:NAD(P)-binding protein [Paenibacillus crassostreae]AOZ90868.1 hypothetical protein LPB68_00705 [Paenibacillus crassostreae]OAB76365.1 hypothetical protein PNBC_02830 [Paenibacillus crassostreae]